MRRGRQCHLSDTKRNCLPISNEPHPHTHTHTGIYNYYYYYYYCIYFVRISDELLHKLDYLVHSVATRYLESFEMWCWRMMEKMSWTDRVRLDSVKDEKHILHTKKEDR